MAGMSVGFKLDGADRVERIFRNIADSYGTEHVMKTFFEVQLALEAYYKARWGEGFTFVADTRLRWPGTSPLYNTGELEASMTDPAHAHAIRVIEPWRMEFGTDVFYGRFINDGTSRMAPKPFLRFDNRVREVVLRVVTRRFGAPDFRYKSGFRPGG